MNERFCIKRIITFDIVHYKFPIKSECQLQKIMVCSLNCDRWIGQVDIDFFSLAFPGKVLNQSNCFIIIPFTYFDKFARFKSAVLYFGN